MQPNRAIIAEAHTLKEFCEKLQVMPDMSIAFHAFNNHFSVWLSTRGEFELAKHLMEKGASDFQSIQEYRQYIIGTVNSYREKSNTGVITQFSGATWDGQASRFSRIGTGSLGGKGRGLGFMYKAMDGKGVDAAFPGVHVRVPWTLAVTTAVFDEFMEANSLYEFTIKAHTGDNYNKEISDKFVKATLPEYVVSNIRDFCRKIKLPLAVRSSSLFEDTFRQPFAGIYKTYFLPNNETDLEVRVREICTAIKLIYASTFWKQEKAYMMSTSFRVEEMKMAVIIQEIVGRVHEDRWLYPDVSGVARAHNFYPQPGARNDHGVALLALGLGSTVVDGGACTRITPHPSAVDIGEPSNSRNSEFQRSFVALDLNLRFREERSLVELPLSKAADHGSFQAVGGLRNSRDPAMPVVALRWHHPNANASDSKQDADDSVPLSMQSSVHGEVVEFAPDFKPGKVRGKERAVENGGVDIASYERVVCMEGVLGDKSLSLRQLLGRLLQIGTEGFECPVEIEWAVNLAQKPGDIHELVLLQTRPMSMWKREIHVGIDAESLPDEDQSIFTSKKALGNGKVQNITDVVFVHPDNFPGEPGTLLQVAKDIGQYNKTLSAEKKGFILICPGRFGTQREGMGIPVSWPDINGTKCIVETDIKGLDVPPSEGTHFFQNIASFGIGYVTVYSAGEGHVTYDWLREHVKDSKGIVQHAVFENPLEIIIDGMTGCAVAMKPGCDFSTVVAQSSAFMSMNSGQYSSL
jgi:hypothetical protein